RAQHIDRRLFEDARAHPCEHMRAAVLFHDDTRDALPMQDLRKQQPRGATADDRHLRLHRLPMPRRDDCDSLVHPCAVCVKARTRCDASKPTGCRCNCAVPCRNHATRGARIAHGPMRLIPSPAMSRASFLAVPFVLVLLAISSCATQDTAHDAAPEAI